MTKSKAKEIRLHLENRLDYALDWYDECDICPETLANARKDVDSIFKEVCKKYNLKDLPFTLKTKFDNKRYIVVSILDRKLN